jgi:hypothetical protein
MIGATRWIFGGLQTAAVVVALAAMAQGRPPKDFDRGGLGQLMVDSTRYLDPQTTGSIGRLINDR